jgi:16S rRNA (guanine1207-N2)-methyltransferase
VFSADGRTAGSLLLAEALPRSCPRGWPTSGAGVGGAVARRAGARGVQALDLIEAERLALDCARLNVADPRARFLWEDATAGARGALRRASS